MSCSAGTRRGRVLHSPEYIPVREVLATARAAGAVVVFAHPTVYKSMPLLRELVREGMVDGIEIDHPSNSPEDKAECAALCGQYHLIHTGGTDFHGANHKKVYPVGTCTTPDRPDRADRGAGEEEKKVNRFEHSYENCQGLALRERWALRQQ